MPANQSGMRKKGGGGFCEGRKRKLPCTKIVLYPAGVGSALRSIVYLKVLKWLTIIQMQLQKQMS